MDSGALEIFLVMRENMFIIKSFFIFFFIFSFLRSISDISVMEKSKKANGQNNYSGSADFFTKRLVVSLCTPFLELKKMALCCSHGLVTFDLKIRGEVRRLRRRVATASVDHRYMMYGRVFLYK